MVSFQCENCGDVLTKKKLDPHRGRCRGATFSCIDCMVHFYGTEYRTHTSCMTEDQKYQGALYKDKNKNKKARINGPNTHEQESVNLYHPTPAAPALPEAPAPPTSASKNNTTDKGKMAAVAHGFNAYVEEVPEALSSYLVPDDDDHSRSDDDAPPHAPTPPPAVPDGPINVFDFLDASATPNASNLALGAGDPRAMGYDHSSNDVNAYLEAANSAAPKHHLVHFDAAAGAVTSALQFQTPAPGDRERERERKKKDKEARDARDAREAREAKEAKDKKRKRLFLDIGDQPMTDAPPAVLHSGLTGGLGRMSTKQSDFSPSPASAATPGSPIAKKKASKSKTSKRHVSSSSTMEGGGGLFSMLTSGRTAKTSKKRKERRSMSPLSGSKKKHRSTKDKDGKDGKDGKDAKKDGKDKKDKSRDKKDAPKLLEYHPEKKDDAAAAGGQMVLYNPRVDLFFSFVNKGPDSERGCSMNKALKRFHRERTAAGSSLAKLAEEKELFRSLRLRKNDRGEIVMFCVGDDE